MAPVAPAEDVPFLVKARHSVFYETQLEYLLRHHGADRLVLLGQVTEQCILYSALDAYVRHFEVMVPRDAGTSRSSDRCSRPTSGGTEATRTRPARVTTAARPSSSCATRSRAEE